MYLDFFGKLLRELLLHEEVTKPLLLSCFERKGFSDSLWAVHGDKCLENVVVRELLLSLFHKEGVQKPF